MGRASVNGPTRRTLAMTLAHGVMTREKDSQALNRVGSGAWRHVQRPQQQVRKGSE